MTGELLYLNGVVMPLSEGRISVEDRGFQLGDGVYEVVKVMNGRPIWLGEHLARLDRSLTAIKMAGAVDDHPLEEVIARLVQESHVVDGLVYIQVTRGVEPRDFALPQTTRPTVLAYARSKPGPSREKVLAGESLWPVEDRRWAFCNIKAVDLLAAVLAKDEALDAGADEALFVTANGRVREAGSSNVFAFLRGVLRTHPADNHILDGITRRHVLELARQAGYSVREEAFRLSDVTSSSDPDREVFVASTLKDIMPVVRVGDQQIGTGAPGKITLALLDLFRSHQAALVDMERPAAFS